MLGAADAFEIAVKLVGLIGDAKAWRLEVRKWALDHSVTETTDEAEQLEAWVNEVDAPLVGQRREALRMWAFDRSIGRLDQRLQHADQLYRWAVKAEDRDEGQQDRRF
jgi:hypothetical protein